MNLLKKYEKFYFTFGTGKSMPLKGGWVLIIANNADEAFSIFRQCFPDKNANTLNCSIFYFEEEFYETSMYIYSDNQGAALHMVLMSNDVYLSQNDRDRFSSEENSMLQNCMHCGHLMVKENLHWINDLQGIPFKKVCEDCNLLVTEEVYNMEDYDSFE